LEQQLWQQLVKELKAIINDILGLSIAIGQIDSLVSLATISNQPGFSFPIFNTNSYVEVTECKHPILAQNQKLHFVPNDWLMDTKTSTLLITGPNMGGKSTYIRQLALLVIMAQIGCKVNAKSAKLPIFDQIFTRIGASDDLAAGQSTFMVEMLEANYALTQATNQSLILFDELGRGTSTYDGMALAQAMIEYITTCIKAKTIFSTHYHELVDLEQSLGTLVNVNMKVKETNNEVVFLYRVEKGKADKSYGINVAKLAHLPNSVIERAARLLKDYEQQHRHRHQELIVEMVKEPMAYQKIKKILNDTDLNSLTPIQALNLLNDWRIIMENEHE
jgi:DNA mismatch repair protein MutS